MAVAAIQTARLSKNYGLSRGLFELDLHVEAQEMFGFVGPNGAGKTTTIRCLMGLIRPTSGSAHVFGLDCVRDYVAVSQKVGHVPGDMAQFGSLRGSEVVAYFGARQGRADFQYARSIAERFNLDLSRRYREYSTGNKQKLGIVLAFMSRPPLLILDEPTSGLDPLNQQAFYALLADARQDGATIFLSSHVLAEVERTCDRVGIIRAGHLIRVFDLDEMQRIRLHHVELEFAPDGDLPIDAIRSAAGVGDVTVSGRIIKCTVNGPFEPLIDALRGATVTRLISREPTLEELFLEYYGEASTAVATTR
jgi:ABC-2 type transport system ATP-binding protein